MSGTVTIRLRLSDDQAVRLKALQARFADACNFIAPMVVQTRCWNRVGLHHMAYKSVRERFPQLGSQMVSNAIYSVSRACRKVYQDPQSQWFVGRNTSAVLPLLRFLPTSPVFFDRHTLSLKSGVLSMFTLDGRLRFQLGVSPDIESRFANEKLREIVLCAENAGFVLRFVFGDADHDANDPEVSRFEVVISEESAA